MTANVGIEFLFPKFFENIFAFNLEVYPLRTYWGDVMKNLNA